MPRWEPDARERLVAAALHLFSEQGFDDTTVAEIADRAGLTKSTFFRYFPDKRDVLTAGQETLSRLFVEGISGAPADATPLTAVAAGLERAAGAMRPFNRELAPHLQAAIAASTELQERAALKQVGLAAAMADALRARGVPDSVASWRRSWVCSRSETRTPHGPRLTTSKSSANWPVRVERLRTTVTELG